MNTKEIKYCFSVGGTYIIWGRKSCPAMNGTTTIYSGNI